MPSSTTTPLTSTRTSRSGSHAIRAGHSTSSPTSSAWLNALEGVFAKLTRRRLKYGVFRSVRDLQDAIRRFIDEHNTTEARPFVWTADPDTIIAARKRGFQTLGSIHYANYPQAADILDVSDVVHRNPETPFPDNANVIYRPYYFSPPARFNVACDEWVSSNANVDILFNHSVTTINIRRDAASSVSILQSSENRSTPAEAFGNEIVIAAGGVQNARLLQLSLPRHDKLPVGRYFCEGSIRES